MNKEMSISEICRLTGLAPHTLRFYEKNFPKLLATSRTPGGHRKYFPHHLNAINQILKLVREEKLSIQEARIRLGESNANTSKPTIQETNTEYSAKPNDISTLLSPIMKKLEELTDLYKHLDNAIDLIVAERDRNVRESLLAQISSLRKENRHMCTVLKKLKTKIREPIQPNPLK